MARLKKVAKMGRETARPQMPPHGTGMVKGKLSREQQKARRGLEKAYGEAFKREAKAAGWGYLKPTAFKRLGDWFVTLHPVIWIDQEKAELWAQVKPFAIDDLISRILGFDGLDGAPLSLRARGPYSLVRPMFTASIENGGAAEDMVLHSLSFLKDTEGRVQGLSIEDFIAFSADDRPDGQASDNLVATLILANRKKEALSLCEAAIASRQWGSNGRQATDGRVVSFFELARGWLANS